MLPGLAAVITAFFTVLAAATPIEVRQGQCNSGSLQCCNSVQPASSLSDGNLLSRQNLDGPIGLDCSPINVLGAGNASCTQQTACCNGDTYGTVTVDCHPIELSL
ncbi:hydrophobin [Pisolithus marmoratus]|nr:hydrophobin [Pisolithus marmoratus]